MKNKNKGKRFNKNIILLIPVLVVLIILFSQLMQSLALTYNIKLPFASSVKLPELPDATTEKGWNLILVNNNYAVPDGYEIEFTVLSNGEKVDKRIYPDLQNMMDDARDQGLALFVADGYRSYEEQVNIYRNKYKHYIDTGYSKKDAKMMTEFYVAIPGTSEHQIGIAVDINADKELCTNEEVYDWLWENSWKYGFIKRYPAHKTNYTGILSEPWHYRYVGKTAAKEIYEKRICLEEYIEKLG